MIFIILKAKMTTVELLFQSKIKSNLICNCSINQFHILSHISFQSIHSRLHDFQKTTTATEKIRSIRIIKLVDQFSKQSINCSFQCKSNHWWSWLMQQLQQNLDQVILILSKKSTFIAIKINTNKSLKINCSHSILFNCIMLWKISILMMKIFIMSIQIKFKIIRIQILIKKIKTIWIWFQKLFCWFC